MWHPKSVGERDAFSRYWSAVVNDAPEDDLARLAANVEPERREIIARMRDRQRHVPDPAFVIRLEDELLRDAGPINRGTPEIDIALRPARDRLVLPRARNLPLPAIDPTRRPIVATVSSLLLVAVTLAIAYLVFINRTNELKTIPAVDISVALPAVPPVDPKTIWPWPVDPTYSVDVELLWRAGIAEPAARDLVPQIAVAPDGTTWAIDGANSRFLLVAPDGALVDAWGGPGTGDGQFDFEREDGNALGGISFAPDGMFYVADSQNARIQQFAADRSFVRAWGGRGTGNGQFLEPMGVNVGPGGNVFVTDDRRNDIQVFAPDGTFLFAFGGAGSADGQLNQPGWGAFDREGAFWIADTGNSRLQRFDANGRHRATIASSGPLRGVLDQPVSVAVDSGGRLYVADRVSRIVQVLEQSGRFLIKLGLKEPGNTPLTPYVDPAGVVIDGEDNVYILDINETAPSLQKFRLVVNNTTWGPRATPTP